MTSSPATSIRVPLDSRRVSLVRPRLVRKWSLRMSAVSPIARSKGCNPCRSPGFQFLRIPIAVNCPGRGFVQCRDAFPGHQLSCQRWRSTGRARATPYSEFKGRLAQRCVTRGDPHDRDLKRPPLFVEKSPKAAHLAFFAGRFAVGLGLGTLGAFPGFRHGSISGLAALQTSRFQDIFAERSLQHPVDQYHQPEGR